jgi:hypothetical protein
MDRYGTKLPSLGWRSHGSRLVTPLLLLLQDHCLYQGHVEGHQGSAASLSICAGLRCVLQTWAV